MLLQPNAYSRDQGRSRKTKMYNPQPALKDGPRAGGCQLPWATHPLLDLPQLLMLSLFCGCTWRRVFSFALLLPRIPWAGREGLAPSLFTWTARRCDPIAQSLCRALGTLLLMCQEVRCSSLRTKAEFAVSWNCGQCTRQSPWLLPLSPCSFQNKWQCSHLPTQPYNAGPPLYLGFIPGFSACS